LIEGWSDIPSSWELALLLIAVGAAIRILAGVFAAAGGAILVRCFYELLSALAAAAGFEVRMPFLLRTPRSAVIIPIRSARFQAALQARRRRICHPGRVWGADLLIGVSFSVSVGRALRAENGLSRLSSSASAYSAASDCRRAREGPGSSGGRLPRVPGLRIYGFSVGILSTLMGIRGGLFSKL